MSAARILSFCLVVLVGCGDNYKGPGPEPIGDLTITTTGETVSAVTTDFADTVVGPILVGDVTFTLRIPAVAIDAGVEITMTPVTLGDAPFSSFGAFRFGPAGTTFRVPATLTAEGLPAGSLVAAATLDDEGHGTVLTFIPHTEGVARATLEHFSAASIIDAANTQAAIGAAGLAHVPREPLEAGPALATAFTDTVVPAINNAGDSLGAFTLAQRLLEEWGAAVQARGLESSPFTGLGGRTFGRAGSDAADDLVVAGQRLLASLSKPICSDPTGMLRHPSDWFTVLGYMAESLRLIGGDVASPNTFSPCVTLTFPPAVLSQGGSIPRDQRFVQVFVGIDATTPDGVTTPMEGSYTLAVTGATDLLGNDLIMFDSVSPGLAPVDLDRGGECAARSSTLGVVLTGSLRDVLGNVNVDLPPAVTTLAYTDAVAFAPGTCTVPTITVSPAFVVVAPGSTHQFVATTEPAGLPVTWSTDFGTIDQQGLYTAGAEQASLTVSATSVSDSSVRGSARVVIIRPDIHTSTNSEAIGSPGSVNQFNTWNWTLDCSSLSTTTEITLSRAERTADPVTPAFSMTVPITSVSQQGLVLRATVPGFDFFNVTFFSGGQIRVDARGPGLPQGIVGSPQTLFDVVTWSNIFFPF